MTEQEFREDALSPAPAGRLATGEFAAAEDQPHRTEQDVRRLLLSRCGLHFLSLVVRRLDNGVCLEGVVETIGDPAELDRAVAEITGVDTVLNRLVVHCPPRKG